MRNTLCSIVLIMMLGLGAANPASYAESLLKAGDRMVFLGDEITGQGNYPRYVMNYFALHYPGTTITFRNAGAEHDTAPRAFLRLKRDVLSLKPTVVSICLGMNDGGYKGPFNQACVDQFMYGMDGIINELTKSGVKVVLLTPGCVDPNANKELANYNDTLAKISDVVKTLSARGAWDRLLPMPNDTDERNTKADLPMFDLYALMLDIQKRAKADTPSFTMLPDGMHPNSAGHAVMAYALLKALGCDEQASGLTIDAAKATAIPDRCTVSDLNVTDSQIIFIRTDDALPVWFDAEAAIASKYYPLIEELNRYSFLVTGLKPGMWKLSVDGIEVGTFTDKELAAGVNLATRPGPWQKLGEDIDRRIAEEIKLDFMRQQQVGVVPPAYENDQFLQVLTKSHDKYMAERERALTPALKDAQPESESLRKKLDSIIAIHEADRFKLTAANHAWKWQLTLVSQAN
jgi:lysophospholipase L1-like esterase